MLKRILDIVLATAFLILLSPVMLVTAVLVRWKMGSPIIFVQKRPGLRGRVFNIYKFRTMTNETDAEGRLVPDRQRLTRFGMLIGKASLDELPELINVIKGDMSLVGPRPLLPEYLERYTPEQSRRHEVRPGMTGLAQISGRHVIPFSRRLELDVYYVDHRSFWMDARIMLMTIPSVLFARGVKRQTIDAVDDLGLNSRSVRGQERQRTS